MRKKPQHYLALDDVEMMYVRDAFIHLRFHSNKKKNKKNIPASQPYTELINFTFISNSNTPASPQTTLQEQYIHSLPCPNTLDKQSVRIQQVHCLGDI